MSPPRLLDLFCGAGGAAMGYRFDAAIHDSILRETGVVEPDEPTDYSHAVWMERWRKAAYGDFTPAERQAIRMHLGLGPFAEEQA